MPGQAVKIYMGIYSRCRYVAAAVLASTCSMMAGIFRRWGLWRSTRAPLAFLHLPKTGGTSVSQWIANQYWKGDQFVCANADDFAQRASKATTDGQTYLPQGLVRGHFRLSDAIRFSRLLYGQRRIFFTVARNPEEQLMSLLWHKICQRLGLMSAYDTVHPSIEVERFLDEFIREAESFEFNSLGCQCSFLTGAFDEVIAGGRGVTALPAARPIIENALMDVDVAGINERLLDSLRLLAWTMGWPAPRDIGTARLSGAGQREVPQPVRAILWRRLELDTIVHDCARSRFLKDYDRLCSAAGSPDEIDAFLDHRAA